MGSGTAGVRSLSDIQDNSGVVSFGNSDLQDDFSAVGSETVLPEFPGDLRAVILARRGIWCALMIGFLYGLVQIHDAKEPVRLPHFSVSAQRN